MYEKLSLLHWQG